MRCSHALFGSAFVVAALAGGYLPSDDAGETGPTLEAESAMFPRLSHAQWENTVRDLLRLPAPPGLASGFTTDPPGSTFDNNVAKMQVTPGLFGDYQRAADDVAAKVVADPKALARIVPPNLPTDAAQKARAFVETRSAIAS